MTIDTRGIEPNDSDIEDILSTGVCYAIVEDPNSEQEWLSLAEYLNENDRLNTVTEINLPTGVLFYQIASDQRSLPTFLFTPKASGKMTVIVDSKGNFTPILKVNNTGNQQSLGNDYYELSFDVVANVTYAVTVLKPVDNIGLYNIIGRLETKTSMPSLISASDLITTGAALNKNGEVYVWGFRGSAQQGNGEMVVSSKSAPQKVSSLSDVTQLVGGAYHLLALDANGDVWGWGQNGYGEAGSKATYVTTPQKVLSNAVQIGAGEYCSVALDASGRVWTWGHNLYGQLGDSTSRNSKTPVLVNLHNETARLVGAAYEGCFAVTKEGHVWAWGDNEASGLGIDGPNYGVQKIIRTPTHIKNLDQYADKIVYIAGGNGWGEALLDDGTVIGWGLKAALGVGISSTSKSDAKPIVIMTGVQQLFARYVGSFALTQDGKLYTWGQTAGSAFKMIYGDTVTLRQGVNSPISRIGGSKESLYYETTDGKLYGVGYNDLYKLNQQVLGAPNVQWPGCEIIFD